jgi:hypothetical protein
MSRRWIPPQERKTPAMRKVTVSFEGGDCDGQNVRFNPDAAIPPDLAMTPLLALAFNAVRVANTLGIGGGVGVAETKGDRRQANYEIVSDEWIDDRNRRIVCRNIDKNFLVPNPDMN